MPAKNANPPMGFEQFCRVAWPDRFTAPFTTDEVGDRASVHDLRAAVRAVMTGGLHAIILERQKGKTTLAMALTIWMQHEGLRRFPVLLRSNQAAAEDIETTFNAMMEAVKSKWHRTITVQPPVSINSRIVARPGVRDKIERPDFLVFDDPTETDQVASVVADFPGISALLLGDIGLCRALQAKGWSGS